MNNMKIPQNNIVISLLALLLSFTTFGYNRKFSNVTERILVICYKHEALAKEYYQIIPPDQSISHFFPHAHCFGQSILWAELKLKNTLGQELPFRGGLDLVNPETGLIPSGEMQQLFKEYLANKYAFIPMQIKVVDNETFQMTANAAEELTRGIDQLACQTINTTAQFMNPLSELPSMPDLSSISSQINTKMDIFNESLEPTNQETPSADTPKKKCRFGLGRIAKAGAGLAGVSLCRDLHFVIVDTGEIGTPAPTKPGVVVSRVKKPILIAEINQGG
jgi:hypothetical protein